MIKKALFILIISTISAIALMGCSEDSDGSSSKGFYTPDRYDIDATIYVVDPIPDPPVTETFDNKFKPYRIDTKSYNIAGQPIASGPDVNVIVYHGSPGSKTYFAIALDNRHDVDPPDFSVRIYFVYGGSISSSGTPITIPAGSYTIQIVDGGSTYTSTTDPLNITITDITGSDNTYNQNFTRYTVDFTTNNITVSTTEGPAASIIIYNGDTITAHKHPDPYADD